MRRINSHKMTRIDTMNRRKQSTRETVQENKNLTPVLDIPNRTRRSTLKRGGGQRGEKSKPDRHWRVKKFMGLVDEKLESRSKSRGR